MNKLFFNPISVILFGLLLLALSLSMRATARRASLSQQELTQLELQIAQQTQDTAAATATLTTYQSEFAREKIARDELLQQRAGEVVVQLPPITSKPNPTPTTSHLPPLQAWKQAIFW